jgi:2-polyprenyl-3-methyl-5-hydroxy-6-metoxy-1,4-benzoquinol methylase
MRLIQLPAKNYQSPYKNDIYDGVTKIFAFGKLQFALWLLPKNIDPNETIVDYGCGFGYWLLTLIKYFKNVIGVDFNPIICDKNQSSLVFSDQRFWNEAYFNQELFKVTRDLIFKTHQKEITLITEKTENIPLKKESIFLITLFDVLEHIKKRPEFIKQLSESLKPNGILIYSVPNTTGPHFLIRTILGKILQKEEDPNTLDHKNYHWKNELKALEAQFDIKSVIGFPFIVPLLSPSVLVKCQKK